MLIYLFMLWVFCEVLVDGKIKFFVLLKILVFFLFKNFKVKKLIEEIINVYLLVD